MLWLCLQRRYETVNAILKAHGDSRRAQGEALHGLALCGLSVEPACATEHCDAPQVLALAEYVAKKQQQGGAADVASSYNQLNQFVAEAQRRAESQHAAEQVPAVFLYVPTLTARAVAAHARQCECSQNAHPVV